MSRGLPQRTPAAFLCDADGCLFPSEEPAYDASAEVTNAFLAELGVLRRYTGEELRLGWTGLNFRATAPRLVERHGATMTAAADLEHWVALEREVVTQHLGAVLQPDAEVAGPLHVLAEHAPLAVVSSSAAKRIDTCLHACDLAGLFPADRRFSAEDSLTRPTSKPDPAIYLHAARALEITPERGLAIEDSTVGVRAAVAAGVPVVGLLQFVPVAERHEREAALRAAGAAHVVEQWAELSALLSVPTGQSR